MQEVKRSLDLLAILGKVLEDRGLVLHIDSGKIVLKQTLNIPLLTELLKSLGVLWDSKHRCSAC